MVLNNSNQNNKDYYNIIQNTDPPAYEMTAKVRILQKRLLEQCTRVFDKDLQVQDLETRYEKLKDEFVKLPGRDIFKEMNNIKRNLMKKDDKMRVKLRFNCGLIILYFVFFFLIFIKYKHIYLDLIW